MTHAHASPWQPIIAAAVALILVHGLGRFVYTPLLPLLVEDGLLSLSQAASLASWNYIGYLIGAMLALWLFQRQLGRSGLITAIAFNAIGTLLQTQADSYSPLLVLRLFNGITNGVVFVLAPALVLEWLVRHHAGHLSGLMYLGVGVGLLGSSVLVDATDFLHAADRWWPAALLSLPLAAWSGWALWRLPPAHPSNTAGVNTALWDQASTPLFLAYAGAGLGYILPMTFLPAVAQQWQLTVQPSAWLIVALASLPSTWLWNHLGARLGDRPALLINYALQASGVAALLIFQQQVLGLWLCAALVGGTFLGSVLLTQRLARQLHPHQGPRLSAALIALYGFTQLLGPWLARMGLERGMDLSSTFVVGLAALVWAWLLMWWVPIDNKS
ncbi:MFS transporter [Bacterioplanes sanyensis]|uniref:MFS transporter n=1 Tax=Bacterioplanes sanyensis TaxID=1249553 RepID=A0A222FHK1_9GAMM|nr:YbfB/YjiJ family MFS transporter [Bacterioplanes sanyensis]ASP37891.1 MFS transporter [Bacterioplanes sanyensis]